MSEDERHARDRQMVSLADEDSVRRVVADSILGLWDVVNHLTRLRPSRRERYRVSIFGSARTQMLSFDPPLASPSDFKIPECAPTADDAIELLRLRHAEWLSHPNPSQP